MEFNGFKSFRRTRLQPEREQPPPPDRSFSFGGTDFKNAFTDTWTWNGENWILKNVTQAPSARSFSAMAFHSATGRILLFGALGLGDTWIYTGQFPNLNTSLTFTVSPATYSRVTGTYIVRVQATNISPFVLNGPFLLALNGLLPPLALNAGGTYLSAPYVPVTDTNGQPIQSINAGETVFATVELPVLTFTPAMYRQ